MSDDHSNYPWDGAAIEFGGLSLAKALVTPEFRYGVDVVSPYGRIARLRRPGGRVSIHTRRWFHTDVAPSVCEAIAPYQGGAFDEARWSEIEVAVARCIDGAFEHLDWWDLPQPLRMAVERALISTDEGPAWPIDDGDLHPIVRYMAAWRGTSGAKPAWLTRGAAPAGYTDGEIFEHMLDIVAFHRHELEKDPEVPFEDTVRTTIAEATPFLVVVHGPRSEEIDIELYAVKVWFETWTRLNQARRATRPRRQRCRRENRDATRPSTMDLAASAAMGRCATILLEIADVGFHQAQSELTDETGQISRSDGSRPVAGAESVVGCTRCRTGG